MTFSSFCRFSSYYFVFCLAAPMQCYRNGLIVFQARKHEKAKRKKAKNTVPCSQAVSVNPKSFGIDVDAPQAIFFCGLESRNSSHSWQTRVSNNVTVSSNCENLVSLSPIFPDFEISSDHSGSISGARLKSGVQLAPHAPPWRRHCSEVFCWISSVDVKRQQNGLIKYKFNHLSFFEPFILELPLCEWHSSDTQIINCLTECK